MKAFYKVTSSESGEVIFKRRRISKAYRRWLRENGIPCKSTCIITD